MLQAAANSLHPVARGRASIAEGIKYTHMYVACRCRARKQELRIPSNYFSIHIIIHYVADWIGVVAFPLCVARSNDDEGGGGSEFC